MFAVCCTNRYSSESAGRIQKSEDKALDSYGYNGVMCLFGGYPSEHILAEGIDKA